MDGAFKPDLMGLGSIFILLSAQCTKTSLSFFSNEFWKKIYTTPKSNGLIILKNNITFELLKKYNFKFTRLKFLYWSKLSKFSMLLDLTNKKSNVLIHRGYPLYNKQI